MARELLEHRGYEVAGEVETAAAAVEAVERLAPDTVLVDMRLPDASGFEVAEALTRRSPAPAVLLVSDDRSVPPAARVRASGARRRAQERPGVNGFLGVLAGPKMSARRGRSSTERDGA